MTVFETDAPAGQGPPLHVHERQDEPARILVGFVTAFGMEQFFVSHDALPEDAKTLDSFRKLAPVGGMAIVAPPLAVSHPTHAPAGV